MLQDIQKDVKSSLKTVQKVEQPEKKFSVGSSQTFQRLKNKVDELSTAHDELKAEVEGFRQEK